MKIPLRSHRVKYRASQDNMTTFAGLKPVMDLARKLGILNDLTRLTVKKRQRGIAPVDFVMSMVSPLLAGGEHLTDVEVLRQEHATRDHLYGLDVPAATTAGEYLRKFSGGHVRQLESVIGRALRKARDLMGGRGPITLDVDSSIFEVHGYLKEGARYGYKKVRGLHPLLCFWSETRLLIGARLRSGNVASADGAVSFLRECLGRLGKVDRVRVRMDAGFYDRKIVEYLEGAGHGISISAKLTKRLFEALCGVSEADWQEYPWEKDAQWAEISYQPANWAWLVIGQLAYNIAQWFKLLLLPSSNHCHQLKKLRLHWFCVAARIIRPGSDGSGSRLWNRSACTLACFLRGLPRATIRWPCRGVCDAPGVSFVERYPRAERYLNWPMLVVLQLKATRRKER